jgi:hypothetical protein
LILAEQLSAHNFYNAVNNYFVDRWFEKGMREIDSDMLQIVADHLCQKLPKEKVILQLLVDEFCSTLYPSSDNLNASKEEEIRRGVLLRCMMRFSELLSVDKESQAVADKRCYLEHASVEEKRECDDLHMRYDDKVGHGFFE